MATHVALSEADILDALAGARTNVPEDAETIAEMASRTGLAVATVRRFVLSLHASGRVQVHRREHVALDGRVMKVPVYTIVRAKKK